MAGFGHKAVSGLDALITNVRYEEKFNTRRYRGLPDVQVIAGRTKVATMTVEGIILQDTDFGSLSATTPVSLTLVGGGKGVEGFLTELTIRGNMNEPVTFTATVVGKPTTGTSGSSQTITASDIVFFDQTSFKTSLSFTLSLSWDLYLYYDPEGEDWPFPDRDKSFIRTFEGSLLVESPQEVANLGSSLAVATFSLTAGGVSISGEGYREAVTAVDNAEDFFKGGYRILITKLT